jgi:hypothetical protein
MEQVPERESGSFQIRLITFDCIALLLNTGLRQSGTSLF